MGAFTQSSRGVRLLMLKPKGRVLVRVARGKRYWGGGGKMDHLGGLK